METNNKILEEYFSYLTMIKAWSPHEIAEFRVDLRLLFMFVFKRRKPFATTPADCSFANIKFIKSITLDDMYAFIAYLQKERNCTVATCARKIISIRQFWKYLKTKVHLIENNITEELEVPKQEILGHESLNTTQIYTHIDDQQLQSAVNTNPLAGMVNRMQQG